MVLLTTTPQILQILSSLPPSVLSALSPTTSDPDTPGDKDRSTQKDPVPLPTSLTAPISHRTLIALSRIRLPNGSTDSGSRVAIPPLDTLLRGTKPYTAPPQPKPAPTPEYTALMAQLRQEQERRAYAALVARQRSTANLSMTDRHADEEEDPISPSLVFNILLSVVMCAVAMFQMTRWWVNDGVRVLVSLGTGLVVGVAEVGVYSIYLMKVRKAREKERTKKERKSFIGEYLPEDDAVQEQQREVTRVMGEKEEIWGRGVNGGMRRRVREKWEREQEKDVTTEE